ncbi:MAG: cysteine desulfurase [Pseudanabaena sp. M57BS1SP1A06MG]|nr:cysteine desulfurase [Pseudanabaena sp. M53BS1SP1A06MG]MCA6581117.1 cysteine desulfurase [Pseudanabaena sp. M34BS1SP1A06MG]MCA6592795.1 cysteine desulfurase [Pseudanabaena sp. M38BS1SP1A06MG]MCA6601327.1 cysteine desulfurase [Pseudanabaena sp. M57BS1SP1A06MG]
MQSDRPIYLDYHATTPVDPRVASVVMEYMQTEFGNASSIDHTYGDKADRAVKQAAKQVADLIGAVPREVIFTSGATESINLVLQGLTPKSPSAHKLKIAVLPIEHKAVLDTCDALVKKGIAEMILLKVDRQGKLDLEHVETTCTQGIDLICVMAANNEIGTIYPMPEIGAIAQRYNAPFLCDATQAVGKIPINFRDWGITYLTLSGHKMYAPKGIGALILRKGYHLQPLIYGGGQQKGIRAGTLNVAGIAGLGEACRLRQQEMLADEQAIAAKRDRLQSLLLESIPDLTINGDRLNRLAGNLHISVPNIPNKAIITRIRDQLAIATGSACSSGVETASHVLQAINLPTNLIEGALRISIGKFTTDAEIDRAANILITAVHSTQQIIQR